MYSRIHPGISKALGGHIFTARRFEVLFGAVAIGLVVFSAAPASAKTFLTRDAALDKVFPGAEVHSRTVFLTDEQVESIEQCAGSGLPSALVYVYEAHREGRIVGTAYIDAHRVRTLPEILMVVVDTEGRLSGLEVLAFREPEEYLPRKRWYAQFLTKALNERLQLDRGIDGITGATLTARATTAAVRRILAVHHVLKHDARP